jgi:hypothetical protein
VTGAESVLSQGQDLDIVEGLTVYYNAPGGAAAVPNSSSSPARPADTDELDNADFTARSTSVSVARAGSTQTISRSLATTPAEQGASRTLGDRIGDRITVARTAIDSFFTDWGSELV